MMSEERVQKFHTDDTTLIWEAASYWLKQIWSLSEALPRSVLQHLRGISALVRSVYWAGSQNVGCLHAG